MSSIGKWAVVGVHMDAGIQLEVVEGTSVNVELTAEGITVDGEPVQMGQVKDNWRVMPVDRSRLVPRKRKSHGKPVHPAIAYKEQRRNLTKGHPGRAAERRKKTMLWNQPDATEKAVQEANRLMRRAIQEAPTGEGLARGPFEVAANHLLPAIQTEHGLGLDHQGIIIEYLCWSWGAVVDKFGQDLGVMLTPQAEQAAMAVLRDGGQDVVRRMLEAALEECLPVIPGYWQYREYAKRRALEAHRSLQASTVDA